MRPEARAPAYRLVPLLFRGAAIYGLLVLLPMYLTEPLLGGPVARPELLYGFVGASLVFQAIYWLIASDPLRYRPLMLAGVACKLSFGVPVVLLWLSGRVGTATLAFGVIDLILAAAFLRCWRLTPA